MVRTAGDDPSEQKVIDDIAKFGWHCVNIMAEGNEVEYAFTIGLFHTYQHPELVIFGLSSEIAHQILSIAVQAIRDNAPLDLSAPTEILLEGYTCCFVEVPASHYYDYVGFCRWFYEGNNFPLYQIVWPSRAGQYPWHPKVSVEFKQAQPVIGLATYGT